MEKRPTFNEYLEDVMQVVEDEGAMDVVGPTNPLLDLVIADAICTGAKKGYEVGLSAETTGKVIIHGFQEIAKIRQQRLTQLKPELN